MRATVLHAPGDVRLEQAPDPTVAGPRDAVVRVVASCICGSDLWPYRGDPPLARPRRMGHEFVGVVEAAGDDVVRASDTHSVCPWKGTASYYSLELDGAQSQDAVWYYPEPKDAARQIKDRVAFWKDVKVTE